MHVYVSLSCAEQEYMCKNNFRCVFFSCMYMFDVRACESNVHVRAHYEEISNELEQTSGQRRIKKNKLANEIRFWSNTAVKFDQLIFFS